MAQKLPTQRSIRVSEVRNHLGSILNRVFRGEEHLVVDKSGVPVAAIISITDYEQYRRYRAQQLHNQLGRELGAEAIKQGLTEEALIASMEEVRQAVYDEMYGANGKSGRESETK